MTGWQKEYSNWKYLTKEGTSHDIEFPVTKGVSIQAGLLPVRNAAKGMSALGKKFD